MTRKIEFVFDEKQVKMNFDKAITVGDLMQAYFLLQTTIQKELQGIKAG